MMQITVRPIHYWIDIRPDLSKFQFKGQVKILLHADTPVTSVVLNSQELAVWQCSLLQEEKAVPCCFSQDSQKETLTLDFAQPQQGDMIILIEYEGLINDAMAGFYRSRFERDGQTHYLAVTQFQESSARRAFPCMDHPLHKAIFELRLTVPEGLTVIANTEPLQEEAQEGLKTVSFAPSPIMSSYLVFFGCGEFNIVQDDKDPRVRLAHLPGLAHTTDLGLDFGRKALQYCEQYYALPYPLTKMDLIAVPDFAYGAMENWGAITFRENLLLRYPGITSRAGVQRICEIIAHEIAHQWFGNLVTPSDWKYLWLNESFATYFGYGVVAHHYPQWQVWDQFLNSETATALARDGLKETFAIEIPGGEHVVINSSTAPIIYNKGASILRMIEGYIGTAAYQQGVRAYLNKHVFGCAQSRHLWEAFEQASEQPISAMMQSWINQAGHPLVRVQRQGDTLHLTQQRFTYLDQPGDQSWRIPITLFTFSDSGTRQQACLMDGPGTTVALPAGTRAYKLNAEQTGFYRTVYDDPENLAALGDLAGRGVLGAKDRWGLHNDLYAQVRQGRLDLTAYLDFLSHFKAEQDYLPLTSMADCLYQAFALALDPNKTAVGGIGRRMAERVLGQVGFEPDEAEAQTTSMLRDQLLWYGVLWQSRQISTFLENQFDRLLQGGRVHADIIKSTLQAGACIRGGQALAWLLKRFEQSSSEQDRMNVLVALGAFRQWSLTEQALAYALEKVPPRNRFVPIAAAAANPANQPHLWAWYQDRRKALETMHPLLYERVITSIWPYSGLGHEEKVKSFGQEYLKTQPHLKDAVQLALENLEINSRMRKFISAHP